MAEFGESISSRELDVLICIAKGASNQEIAQELVISPNTVKVHLRNIYTKLGVSSRTEAAVKGMADGLLPTPNGETASQQEGGEDENDELIVESIPVSSTIQTSPIPQEVAPDKSSRGWLPALAAVAGISILSILAFTFFPNLREGSTAPTSIPFATKTIEDSRWFAVRSAPAPIAGMATASVGINLYFIGGERDGEALDSVLAYDVKSHNWQQLANKPTPVTNAAAAVLGGEIYLAGGLDDAGDATNLVEAYSPINNAWRPIANLPQPIEGAVLLSDGSALYLFGGTDEGLTEEAYQYDQATDGWRPIPGLPTPRRNAIGGFISGEFIIVGGSDGSPLTTCEKFNISESRWESCPDMLAAREGAGAATIHNSLYVLGGEADFGEFYNINVGEWQLVNMPMLQNAGNWRELGVAFVENRILAVGGYLDGQPITDAYIFSPLSRVYLPAAPNN